MKKIKTLIILAFIGALIGAGVIVFIKYQENKSAWKIEITEEMVNVREEHGLYEYKVGTAVSGDIFKVLDFYDEDARYVWYKVKLKNGTIGWIASGRNVPYVKEINNPKGIASYEIDYAKPKIRFFEEDYVVYDIKSISYNHLEIIEDSEYTIEHIVYYEEHPKDKEEPQYWIKYIVTDAFGNKASKVQRIIFTVEPDNDEVLDFSSMEKAN